jgi:hypothetical protein
MHDLEADWLDEDRVLTADEMRAALRLLARELGVSLLPPRPRRPTYARAPVVLAPARACRHYLGRRTPTAAWKTLADT